jgi:hypothetical protein
LRNHDLCFVSLLLFLFFLANEVGETTNVGAVIGGRCTIIETNVREEEEEEEAERT